MVSFDKEDISARRSDTDIMEKAILPPLQPRRRQSGVNLKVSNIDDPLQDLDTSLRSEKKSVSSAPVTSRDSLLEIPYRCPGSINADIHKKLGDVSLDVSVPPAVLTETQIDGHLSDFTDKAILPPSQPRRKRSGVNLKDGYIDDPLPDLDASLRSEKKSVSSAPVTSRNKLLEIPYRSPGSIAFTEPIRRSVNTDIHRKLGDVSLNVSVPPAVLTEARIRCHLSDFIADIDSLKGRGTEEGWELLFERYLSDDYVLIRPSGNPAERDYMVKLWTVDMQLISRKLVSIDNIQILAGGKTAVVLYTSDNTFVYKGTYNEDRAILSCVMELQGDAVKIVHEHRTRGIPIPKETRWAGTES